MSTFNAIFSAPFNFLLGGFHPETAWVPFVVICLLSTVLVLLIFKYASNQRLVRRRKDIAVARLLEFVLFKDDIVVNLGAFGRTMAASLAYLGVLIVPLLLGLVPMILVLIQLSCWFDSRPLRPGETTILTVKLQDHIEVMNQDISLTTSSGLSIEGAPVRAPSQNEISWKLRATEGGTAFEWTDVKVNGEVVRKSIATGNGFGRVSSSRPRKGTFEVLTNPCEDPLPKESQIAAVYAAHPAAQWTIVGHDQNWIVVFCVLSLLLGIGLMKPLRVEL